MKPRSRRLFPLLIVTLGTIALTACSGTPKATTQTPTNPPPKAVQQQEEAAQQQSNKIQKTTDRAQQSINQSAQDVKDAEKAAEAGK